MDTKAIIAGITLIAGIILLIANLLTGNNTLGLVGALMALPGFMAFRQYSDILPDFFN